MGEVGEHGSVSKALRDVQIDDDTWQSEVSEGGQAALTLFEVLERYHLAEKELILLKVMPKTGRRHQIRVHLASLGRPLVGDLTYGAASLVSPRLFLHCHRLSFLDSKGERFQVEAPLPQELLDVLRGLEKLGMLTMLTTGDMRSSWLAGDGVREARAEAQGGATEGKGGRGEAHRGGPGWEMYGNIEMQCFCGQEAIEWQDLRWVWC